MTWLIFYLASGDSLWTAMVLAALCIAAASRWRERWVRVAIGPALVVAGVLGWGSGAPIPSWLLYPAIASVCARYVGEWVRPREGRGAPLAALRVIAVVGILLCMAAEVPWHVMPEIRGPAQRRVYVVGDSISAGLGHAEITPWPAVLADIAAMDVRNLAVAGATAQTALAQIDGQQRLDGLVLVEIGGNDMFGALSAEQYAAHLDRLLSQLKSKAQRVVMVELPVLPGGRDYAVAQRRLATQYDVPMIPKREFARILLLPGNTLDGLHLTQQGHNAMAQWVWSILKGPLGESRASRP